MDFRKFLVTIFASLMAHTIYADDHGSIVVFGKGMSTAAPDYVSLSIKVSSICYETSQDAQAANAKLATRLVDILKGFKTNDRDKLTASGGANYRQTETIMVDDTAKVLCALKWRSENTLTLDMVDITELASLQDAVFSELNQVAEVNPEASQQTYAEVSRPVFSLFTDTALRLRNEAQTFAFNDAKEQFNGLNSRCDFVDPRLVSIAPPEFSYAVKSYGERSSPGYASPVIPDAMEVHASLRVEWQFTPNSPCK